jgi:ricin-type beta-trefoil lectin protein
MRIKVGKPAAAAAIGAALMVAAGPAPARAATVDRTLIPLSVIRSPSLALDAGPYRIKNQKSSKFLQPYNDAETNGTKIVQANASTSNTLQGWTVYADGSYSYFNNYGVNRNLGLSGTSTATGTAAVLANGSSSFDQDWTIEKKDSTWFRLKNRKDSTKCLGITGASTAANAVAAIYTCDTSTNQTWAYATFS